MAEYIDREAALDIVNGWRNQLIPTYGKNDEYVICLETVAEHLGSLHAADVRPVVRGKWIWRGFNIKCPFCEFEPQFDSTESLYNFCPNCGADMREERRLDWCPLVEVPEDYSEDGPSGVFCNECLCSVCEWRESCGTQEGNTSEYCRTHCRGEVGCMTRCSEFKRMSIGG